VRATARVRMPHARKTSSYEQIGPPSQVEHTRTASSHGSFTVMPTVHADHPGDVTHSAAHLWVGSAYMATAVIRSVGLVTSRDFRVGRAAGRRPVPEAHDS